MSNIRTYHKLSQYGQELATLEGQGQRAIDTLTTLQTSFEALQNTIQNDESIPADEREAAAQEVNAALAATNQAIKDFASTL